MSSYKLSLSINQIKQLILPVDNSEVVLRSVLWEALPLKKERVRQHRFDASGKVLGCILVQVAHEMQCWKEVFLHDRERHVHVVISNFMELVSVRVRDANQNLCQNQRGGV